MFSHFDPIGFAVSSVITLLAAVAGLRVFAHYSAKRTSALEDWRNNLARDYVTRSEFNLFLQMTGIRGFNINAVAGGGEIHELVDAPHWMQLAWLQMGTRELEGAADNPVILSWARELGVPWIAEFYKHDETPWCGLFIAVIAHRCGFKLPASPLSAKSWATWGVEVQRAVTGCLLIFQRTGGGHVGFCMGERADAYLVLGGNQGDAVSIAWIKKDRCIAKRWPAGVPLPEAQSATPPPKLQAPLSTNEA